MHRTPTLLLTLFAVAFSTAAFSQNVSLTRADFIPAPEARVTGAPVFAKDKQGNFCQAVSTHPAGGTTVGTWLVAKYLSSGMIRWTMPWPYPVRPRPDLDVTAIALDPAGNVIVAGTVNGNGADTEAVVTKWDPTGAVMWNIQLGLGQSLTAPTCMTTDTLGNIYIGGTVRNSPVADSADFLLLRIDNNGSLVWSRTYNGSAGRLDQVTAIATDASGNVYITGESKGEIKFTSRFGTEIIPEGLDYETIKYDGSGQVLWSNRYYTNLTDIPSAITLDAAGNAYVTGSANGVATTVCYNGQTGTGQWVAISASAQNNTSIALDPSGNVVTAGYAINSGNLNYIISKYTPTGSLSWSATAAAGPYAPFTYGPNVALAIDKGSFIYISGESIPLGAASVQNLQFLTQRYAPTGQSEWSQYYSYGSGYANIPSWVTTVEPAVPSPFRYPTVFVGGYAGLAGGNSELASLTYTQSVIRLNLSASVDSVSAKTASPDDGSTAALANYPNPFHGTTTIAYSLTHQSHVTLQLFDASGKTIATLLNDDEPAGLHTFPFTANRLIAGIYAYRIVATSPQGNLTTTKQMIIQ